MLREQEGDAPPSSAQVDCVQWIAQIAELF